MPLCSKHPAFVEAPLFAEWFPIGGVAYLNQLSAPSQSFFPTQLSAAQAAALPSGPALLIFRRQKGALSFLPNPAPQTQVPEGACSTRGVFAGSARHLITAVFRPLWGALRSNTPFKVGQNF
jgi:hypothetical protein